MHTSFIVQNEFKNLLKLLRLWKEGLAHYQEHQNTLNFSVAIDERNVGLI
jgi:hypothetical protein